MYVGKQLVNIGGKMNKDKVSLIISCIALGFALANVLYVILRTLCG